uniref:PID domain-containing protein n=1 Tax=Rhabditophanes sp. KR3021 TaxID=114890 RepID=A0AC35TTT3_9BILA
MPQYSQGRLFFQNVASNRDIPVSSAIGIEVLNGAIDKLVQNVFPDRWILVDVSIAPSTIIINEVNGSEIARCRVRYLSFLGIGQDIKRCAFIMETSSESYMCYVFEVEPSAAAMAKTIEAACKLRYQKVLDYHTTKQFSTTGSNYGGYSQVNEPIGRNDREKAKNAYF